MKLLISLTLILFLSACGKDRDNSAPVGDNTSSTFLTPAEVSTYVNMNWCQNDVSVILSWSENGYARDCSVSLTVQHDITQFSEKEFFGELSYSGKKVFCKPSWGQGKFFDQNEITEALKDNSYRVSMTGDNLALMTKVGEGNKSVESEVFIGQTQVKIAPVDKTLRPTVLYICNSQQ